jgi:hypothetical protein
MLEAFKAAGFHSELHYLDLATAVSRLMGHTDDAASDQWAGVYVSFLQQASQHELTADGGNLTQLAEECYLFLKACGEIEERCRLVNGQ